MGFRVEPDRIDSFASLLRGLQDDVQKAQEYLNEHLSYGYGEARMFATIANANTDTKAAVGENIDHLGQLVSASARELENSVQMYRDTDSEAERKLDEIYPRSQ